MTIIKFGQREIALIIDRKSVLIESKFDAFNVTHVGGEKLVYNLNKKKYQCNELPRNVLIGKLYYIF